MPRLAITVSEALLVDLDAIAERDAPGAPNRSATGLRLLALGIAEEKRLRPIVAEPARALRKADTRGAVGSGAGVRAAAEAKGKP